MINLIITFLWQFGEIIEVRLIKNFVGRSKGFAYIEFQDEVSPYTDVINDFFGYKNTLSNCKRKTRKKVIILVSLI